MLNNYVKWKLAFFLLDNIIKPTSKRKLKTLSVTYFCISIY